MQDEIQNLLEQCRAGDADAMGRLFQLLDHDLRLMAHRYLRRERPDSTLRSTALLQEVFIRLLKRLRAGEIDWRSLDQFLGSLAWQMQKTVLDTIRHRLRQKRGGAAVRVSAEDGDVVDDAAARYWALHRALAKLRDADERSYNVFMYLEYMGQTVEETGDLLGIGRATVFRDKKFAKTFLKAQIGKEEPSAAQRFIRHFEQEG